MPDIVISRHKFCSISFDILFMNSVPNPGQLGTRKAALMTKQKDAYVAPPGIFLLILACFFLSGLSGLIYEILWTRMIVKIIGSAPFAVSTILSIFMGGLGVGAYLAGRIIDRIEQDLALVKLYGLLELLIGAYCLLIPPLLTALLALQTMLYNGLYEQLVVYHLITFVLCAAIFGLPVVSMGATLPILCRFYVRNLGHLGGHIGRLCGLNTIGAALGSLVCGFWLIDLWGVTGSLAAAVAVNLVIGLACLIAGHKARLIVSNKVPGMSAVDIKTEEVQKFKPVSAGSFERKASLVIFGISGFCAMAAQVIWTRLLGLMVGPTTYSFTIVLVTFITGLALGSMIFGYLADKVKNSFHWLLATQIAAALLVLGVSQLMGGSQLFFAKLIFSFKDQFAVQHILKAAFIFGFMIWPTLCFGACFPLVGKICTRSVTDLGRSIGLAYMINAFGALLGPVMAGFVLIPLVGKATALSLVVGLQLIACLWTAAVLPAKKKQLTSRFWLPATAALMGLVVCFYYPTLPHHQLSVGKYHRFNKIQTELTRRGWLESLMRGKRILTRFENDELVYCGEGIGGFTTVTRSADALGKLEYCLTNSGKPEASTQGDMGTQTIAAHFPMLFQKDPRSVMVIGLASGVTAGEVLYYPVEKLDVLEINAEVAAASDYFRLWNNNVLSDPRTQLIIQDARAHLQLTDRRYDVIISEPSNPWMAGLAALFTRDFFALAKERLTDEGVFVQWMHAYQMDWESFALAGRTFAEVFPNSLLLVTGPSGRGSDYLLVGIKGQKRLNLKYATPKQVYARKSNNVDIRDPRLFFRMILSQNLPHLFGQGEIHTDNRPRLEFSAPRLMFNDEPQIRISRQIHSQRWSNLAPETLQVIRQVVGDTDSQIDYAALALSLYSPFDGMIDTARASASQVNRFYGLVEKFCTENEVDFSIFSDNILQQRCLAIQIDVIAPKVDRLPDRLLSYSYLGTLYSLTGQHTLARNYYTKALKLGPLAAPMHNNLGIALIVEGRMDEAIHHFSEAIRTDAGYEEAYVNLGHTHFRLGRFDEAISHYNDALRLNPRRAKTHYRLGLALAERNRPDDAARHFDQALRLDPNLPGARYHKKIARRRARN